MSIGTAMTMRQSHRCAGREHGGGGLGNECESSDIDQGVERTNQVDYSRCRINLIDFCPDAEKPTTMGQTQLTESAGQG
jgi:hypothetical protein